MQTSRRNFLRSAGLAAGAVALTQYQGSPWSIRPAHAASAPHGAGATLKPAAHVANRLTFGARPEDIAKIESMGLAAYIDWQLKYEAIPDPAINTFVANNPLLGASFYTIANATDKNVDKALQQLLWGRIYRAAFSERQLYEKMVEFWSDHFSIPVADYTVAKFIDDRSVARKYPLAKFRDILKASATSPAMLAYLSNDASDKDHPNENYARELMELHTLGVDGGYTEQDVKNVARAFTGWSTPDDGPSKFLFRADNHDTDEKTVLGHHLPAGRGQQDGLDVIEILATHPSTAHFIAKKLVRRFVSDIPPASLVASAAATFSATDGDIREVMRHILKSDAFMAATGQKFRRPIDFMAALFRLTHGKLKDPQVPLDALWGMGQVPFNWHPPNGYPDAAAAWMGSGALLTRWNVAFDYVGEGGREAGILIDLAKLIPKAADGAALVDQTIHALLPGAPSAADREALIGFAENGGPLTAENFAAIREGVVGLVLASPYFQWY
jgi:uncharacterized protein (DUF1800 family)